jgi:type 1 glutamine amidotransferase
MFRRLGLTLGFLLLACACSSEQPLPTPSSGPSPAPGRSPIRVLMLTATAGFRHDSISTARQVMSELAARGELTVTMTEDVSMITASTLGGYDVLFFALTSGELPFTAEQEAAIVSFVRSGGGFLGAHSAADTLYDWPDYGALLGAYFKEHPWTQLGAVVVENQSHPATAGLGDRFSILEEFYTFRDNPRPHVQVLLRLDAGSVGSIGDFPLAWTQTYGSGRVYYNALGHFAETWRDARYQQQIAGAIRWLAGR